MGYKILYVEDQKAQSIQDDLARLGYEVVLDDSDDFITLLDKIHQSKCDAFLLDFRLTANRGRVDAPTIAQTLRTQGINYQQKPVFLISYEDYLKEFDRDLTSQDLFDFAVSKQEFRSNLQKYCKKINSFIEAYKKIKSANFELDTILGITKTEKEIFLDYRLEEKVMSDQIKNDPYAYCRFINIALIRSVGPLIGEDILAARLGVDREANQEEWKKLLVVLESFKYTGVLAETSERWWMKKLEIWWRKISGEQSLRSIDAEERIKILNRVLKLQLIPAKPLEKSSSSYFWTICMETKRALDPSEGYIIDKKELFPWQEMEYLSLFAALEQSPYRRYLSPVDKKEIRGIEKQRI